MSNFAPSSENILYSASPQPGIGSGNIWIDSILGYLMGNKPLFPRAIPGTTQTLYDSSILSNQNRAMNQIGRNAFASSRLFASFGGLDPNSFAMQMAGAGDPNGIAGRLMAPLIGGNPMQAQMGWYSAGQGINRDMLGLSQNMTVQQVSNGAEAFNNSFYTTRKLSQKEFSARLEVEQNRINQEMRDMQSMGGIQRQGAVESSLSFVKDDKERAALRAEYEKLSPGNADEMNAWSKKLAKARTSDKGYGGIDFAKTRGFKQEDIWGAASVATATGAMTFRGDDAAAQFLNNKNAMSALDAGRGVFGNDLSGSAMMKELDAFAGRDADSGMASGKMDKALRSVKAMSRKLGVDVKAMQEMLKATSDLADSLGIHGGLSQMVMADTATSTMSGVRATLKNGGQNVMRANGGEQQMAQNVMVGNVEAAGDANIAQLHALYQKALNSGNTKEAAKIAAYMKDPKSDFTGVGVRNFVQESGARMGLNASDSVRLANNKAFQGAGARAFMANNPGVSQAALVMGGLQETVMAQLDTKYSDGMMDAVMQAAYDDEDKVKALIAKEEEAAKSDPSRKERVAQLKGILAKRQANSGDRKNGEPLQQLGLDGISQTVEGLDEDAIAMMDRAKATGGDVSLSRTYNSTTNKFYEENRKAIDETAAIAKEYEEKNARFNAPLMTNAMSLAMEGKLDKDSIGSFISQVFTADELKNPGSKEAKESMEKMLNRVSTVGQSGYFKSDVEGAKEMSAAFKSGITGDMLAHKFNVDGKEVDWDDKRAEAYLKEQGVISDKDSAADKKRKIAEFKAAREVGKKIDKKGDLLKNAKTETDLGKIALGYEFSNQVDKSFEQATKDTLRDRMASENVTPEVRAEFVKKGFNALEMSKLDEKGQKEVLANLSKEARAEAKVQLQTVRDMQAKAAETKETTAKGMNKEGEGADGNQALINILTEIKKVFEDIFKNTK